MPYEQRELSGALFKNDKEGNDNRPDYTGNCLIAGKTWRIAAWIKARAGSDSFMSLSFSEPQAPQQPANEAYNTGDIADVPF